MRAARWTMFALLVAAAGVVLVVAGVTVQEVRAADPPLARSANQTAILGAALSVMGLACSAGRWAWQRLRGSGGPVPSRDMLRAQVAAREQEVRSALLAGLVPANLGYADAAGAALVDGRAARPSPAGPLAVLQRAVGSLLRYTAAEAPSAGETAPSAEQGDLKSVGGYFAELESGRLVVLGRPGAGKTVLAIELVLQLLRRQAEEPAASGRIPVRLGAATWVPGQDLGQWMAQRLILDYRLPAAAATQLVADGEVLPVLDGLDEMDPEPLGPTGPGRALALLRELNAYGDLGRPAPVVVTCRAGRYEQIQAAGPGLLAGQVITIGDLDAACLSEYLHARYAADRRALEKWQEVLGLLCEPGGGAAKRVLATPWRLLLAITAAEDGQDPRRMLTADPSEDPAAAERRIVAALLASYIPAATRLTPRREGRPARYQPRKVERWMRALAGHLDWQAAWVAAHPDPPPGMTVIDIVPHLLWPMGGARLVRGIHMVLGLLTATAAAVVIANATLGSPRWTYNISYTYYVLMNEDNYGLGRGVLRVATTAVAFGILGYAVRQAGRRWPAPGFSARSARVRHLDWGRFTAGFVAGSVPGFAAGLLLGPSYVSGAELNSGIQFGLAVGGLVGLAAGLAAGTGLAGGTWMPDAMMVSPRHALKRQMTVGLVIASVTVTVVVFVILLGRLAWGSPWSFSFSDCYRGIRAGFSGVPDGTIELGFLVGLGLIAGLVVGLVVGLAYASSWLRYIVGQICAVTRRNRPLRLGMFLSWACESGLLRVSGATYQFRHRELQDWLSSRSAAGEPSGRLRNSQSEHSANAR